MYLCGINRTAQCLEIGTKKGAGGGGGGIQMAEETKVDVKDWSNNNPK